MNADDVDQALSAKRDADAALSDRVQRLRAAERTGDAGAVFAATMAVQTAADDVDALDSILASLRGAP